MFNKIVILVNFTKFTGKHLCQGLFLNKVADLRRFLRTPFLEETPPVPILHGGAFVALVIAFSSLFEIMKFKNVMS